MTTTPLKSVDKRGMHQAINQSQTSTWVFSEGEAMSMADKALSVASDKDVLKVFIREHGCTHCIPKHLKKKLSEQAALFIFKDGSSLVTDPKSKNGPLSRNEEETLDFLKAKPSKNEIFFKFMQIKKMRKEKNHFNARLRDFPSIDY